MANVEEPQTKGERRETKRRKRRKMNVVGASVKRLQEIVMQRAKKASQKAP